MTKKERVAFIKSEMLSRYKEAKTELTYRNDYELLVAIILSAQCTDKRVNIVTPALFETFPNLKALANGNLDDIKTLIKSCSFFNNKAKNIQKMAQSVVDNHNGAIPQDEKSLMALSGVGQKTAHVFMIEYLGANLMAVDTHVFRVSHRLGLSIAKNVENTEKDLVKLFKTDLQILHQAFVLFGRYICKAIKPLCDECFLYTICKSKDKRI